MPGSTSSPTASSRVSTSSTASSSSSTGIDFDRKVKMGIRNNRYDAMVPVVTGPLSLKGRVHATEANLLQSHTARKRKLTLPGPMTIVDTIADEHYGDKVKLAMAFAGLLNQEARALEKDGVDVIQFDEPAFNVYMDDVKRWGIDALHRAIEGLKCTTCVHICYGYGIQANIDWKKTLGGEWRQYEEIFPALAKSRIDQISLECIHSKVPIELLRLLKGKDVLVGVIDVANDKVETPQEVAAVIERALKYVPAKHFFACTNCGMAPMDRDVAAAKLRALVAGAALARRSRRTRFRASRETQSGRYANRGTHFLRYQQSESREALRLRPARVAAGLERAASLVELRAGDEAFAPVGRDVDVVAAPAQLVDHLRAEARLDAHAVGLALVRREEAREVLAGQARRLDRVLQRHAESRAVEEELQQPLALVVAAHGAEGHPGLARP